MIKTREYIAEVFPKDVANHEMVIIRDDGVNRHLGFKAPDTYSMSFDILTWPGYLCYTGDMGTYVFKRLRDMFEFFRKPSGKFDAQYWAEKLESMDKVEGFENFSPETFRENLKGHVADFVAGRGMAQDEADALWDDVMDEVCSKSDSGYDVAMRAALEFEFEGKPLFPDFWEYRNKEYSPRFLWCCHALIWAIEKYDAAKVTT